MNDYMKLTSNHRQSKNHEFKTPPIPLHKRKYKKARHNNSTSQSIVKESIFVETSHSISSKSENKRKVYTKNISVHTSTHSLQVVTPASDMMLQSTLRGAKRKREDHQHDHAKRIRRRMAAVTFKIEPIDEVDFPVSMQRLFSTDSEIKRCTVDLRYPDQNENLLVSKADLLRQYKKKNGSNFGPPLDDFNSRKNREPLIQTKKVDSINNNRKLDDFKQERPSPVDIKFDIECAMKIEDTSAPAIPMDVDEPSVVVVQTESDKIDLNETESSSSNDGNNDVVPTITFPGQLLWVRYQKYPYWPAIVWKPATDETKGRVLVKFFADRGTSGEINKGNYFEFRGIDAFLQYRQTMFNKLSKADYTAWFTATKKRKSWAKAVVEGTFVMSEDVNNRLPLFEIIFISSLRDTLPKNPNILSKLIAEHSTETQLEAVRELVRKNPNIFDEIKQKLTELTPTIDLSAVSAEFVRLPPVSSSSSSSSSSPAPKTPQTPAPTKLSMSPAQNTPKTPAPTKLSNATINDRQCHTSPSKLLHRRTSRRLASFYESSASRTEEVVAPVKKEIETSKIKEEKKKEKVEKKRMKFEEDLEKYAITAREKESLFKGLRRKNICKKCLKLDERESYKCAGYCGDQIHRDCASNANSIKTNKWRCDECSDPSSRTCYACKGKCTDSSSILHCKEKTCGRYYHEKCLSDCVWPQTKAMETGKVLCPAHVCHTCVSGDPKNDYVLTSSAQLTRCIKCLAAYHTDSKCIPAGVKLLTKHQHICIRHREMRTPINLTWCYVCGQDGTPSQMNCCKSCPLVAHEKCSKAGDNPNEFICDGCEHGQHPLYGQIVWAKYHDYDWWPAIIVPPACIPDPTTQKKHREHDFCIRFFGYYNYGWISRSSVYLWEEDDQYSNPVGAKLIDACREADKWGRILSKRKDIKKEPSSYKKIQKIMQTAPAKLTRRTDYVAYACDCSPHDDDPCGPTSECTNRYSYFECDPKLCPAGDKCQNQSIEKQIYAPFVLKHFEDKGFGLIADANIRAGTFIIEYIGELVTKHEYKKRSDAKKTKNFYFMQYGNGMFIDAELMGNMSRFINHSCNPNCETQVMCVMGFDRIGIFATTDIEKGEELTFNYQFDGGNHQCHCGEDNCLGIIGKTNGGRIGSKRYSTSS